MIELEVRMWLGIFKVLEINIYLYMEKIQQIINWWYFS